MFLEQAIAYKLAQTQSVNTLVCTTKTAGTDTTTTTLKITAHGLKTGDIVTNNTRSQTRYVTVVDVNTLTVASITGQTAGDVIACNTRIYPSVAPQGVSMPYIVIDRVASKYSHRFGADTGYCNTLIDVCIYADTYGKVKNLAKEVRKALANLTGIVGTVEGTTGVTIQATTLDDERESFFADVSTHEVQQEYTFTYIEEV